jgi:hypothetical protein
MLFTMNVSAETFYKVDGKLISKSQECTNPTQLFVSQNKVLLYQLELPVNGKFSLTLKQGEYYFRAANDQKCETQLMKLITDKPKESFELVLNKMKGQK